MNRSGNSVHISNSAKGLLLLFIAFITIGLFFLLPANKTWYKSRVQTYWREFLVQRKNLDMEKRKAERFGSSYTLSRQVADYIKAHASGDVVVLIPPYDYFREHAIDYEVPVPAIFYYYTGIKSLWANNSNAASANWFVTVKNGKITVEPVTNTDSLHLLITSFKKYKVRL